MLNFEEQGLGGYRDYAQAAVNIAYLYRKQANKP